MKLKVYILFIFAGCILKVNAQYSIINQQTINYKPSKSIFSYQLEKKSFKEILPAASLGIATVGSFAIDQKIANRFQNFENNYPVYKNFSKHYTELGSYYGIAALGLFTLGSYVSGNEKATQSSKYAGQALFLSVFATGIIKISAGRERPYHYFSQEGSGIKGGKWYGPSKWRNNLSLDSPFDSFSSGHTAIAFALATTFSDEYKNLNWLPWISYSAATLVGFTRISQNKHWLSDVLFGAMVGFLSSKASSRIRNKWLSQIPINFNHRILESEIKNENYFS